MPSPAKMDVCAGLNSKLPTCIILKARRRIQIRTAMPFPRWHSSTFHFSPNRSPCIPPELPIHHQRRAPHNYRTPIESGILTCLSSTPYNSEKSSNYTPRKRQNSFHWHFHWHYFDFKTRVGLQHLPIRTITRRINLADPPNETGHAVN